jgi:hypothetical protein
MEYCCAVLPVLLLASSTPVGSKPCTWGAVTCSSWTSPVSVLRPSGSSSALDDTKVLESVCADGEGAGAAAPDCVAAAVVAADALAVNRAAAASMAPPPSGRELILSVTLWENEVTLATTPSDTLSVTLWQAVRPSSKVHRPPVTQEAVDGCEVPDCVESGRRMM